MAATGAGCGCCIAGALSTSEYTEGKAVKA
jgi:hypothetical protein